MKNTASLRVESCRPDAHTKRIGTHDYRVFLNDVELTTLRNITFSMGVDEGPGRVHLDLWVDRLEVDADVIASLKNFTEPEPQE